MVRLFRLPADEHDAARHGDLTTAERANLDLVVRAYDVIAADGEPDLAPYYSPGYRDHASGVSPGNLDGFRAFLAGFREANPDGEIAMDRVLADRDLVFLQGRGRQRPDDPWSHTMEVFRIASGQIVEHWEVLEIASNTQARPEDGAPWT